MAESQDLLPSATLNNIRSDIDDGVELDADLTENEVCCDEENEQGESVKDQAWLFIDENYPPEQ